MSAIGGFLAFDGGPVDAARLERLAAALQRRAPDHATTFAAASIGLVHRAYGTTADDTAQTSLWQSPRGDVLTFDGRLDNREELAAWLGAMGPDT